MKTLVIHPVDETTAFLDECYKDRDWTICTPTAQTPRHILVELIKSHDRIIMMGHGSPSGLGLFNLARARYIIDPTFVYLLREKFCVAVWCNADQFFEKYKINGHYTGMIISELDEADWYDVKTTNAEVEESNLLFTQALKESLDILDGNEYVSKMRSVYNKSSDLYDFNWTRIYSNATEHDPAEESNDQGPEADTGAD